MTVKPIDRMLAAIRRDSHDELILETGKPIRIKSGDAMRVILAQDVRADQVTGLLRDVAPPEVSAGLFQDGEATFAYDAPSGPFQIDVKRRGPNVDARVKPRIPGAPTSTSATPATSAPEKPFEKPAIAAPSTSASPTPAHGIAAPPKSSPKAIGVVALQQKVVEQKKGPRVDDEGSGKMSVLKNMVDRALVSMAAVGGTDLHLVAGLAPRMRRDGSLIELPGFADPLGSDTIRSWLLEVAPESARARFEKTHDAEFCYDVTGVGRFRIGVFRERRGVAGSIRCVAAKVKDAEEIGLPAVVRDLAALERGLVIVTGPLGSGRSTTLAALVDVVNQTRAEHVVTIEDPVEILHEPKLALITQRELKTHAESLPSALHAAVKLDPNVLMISELRDVESLLLAMEIAETGPLVFAGMRLPTASQALERILDLVPADKQSVARVMLAESLKGVVAQALCKRVGGGRVAAFEVMLGVPQAQMLIREGSLFQLPALMQQGKQVGMRSLNDALVELVADGQVSAEEAYHRAVDKAGIQPALERLVQQASA